MLIRVIPLAALLLSATAGWADEKDAKPGSGDPPPGKGWRKNEPAAVPAKPVKPQPPVAETPKRTKPGKPQSPVAAKPQPGGIGKSVSQWARSGIRGPALAAKIHELQASLGMKSGPPQPPAAKPVKPPKAYQPEVPAPLPKGPKKKGGAE